METSLFSIRRTLLQLLLVWAFVSLVLVQASTKTWESVCVKDRIALAVNYDGCEPAMANFTVCNGACLSSMTSINRPPYQARICNSCRPTVYRTKPKRIIFNCDGEKVEHRVYFSHVEECGCVDSSANIG